MYYNNPSYSLTTCNWIITSIYLIRDEPLIIVGGGGVLGTDCALTFLFLSKEALAFFFLGNKALAFFSLATRHLLFFLSKTRHPTLWGLFGGTLITYCPQPCYCAVQQGWVSWTNSYSKRPFIQFNVAQKTKLLVIFARPPPSPKTNLTKHWNSGSIYTSFTRTFVILWELL